MGRARRPVRRYDWCGNFIGEYESINMAAQCLAMEGHGISKTSVSSCCNREQSCVHGNIYRYADDDELYGMSKRERIVDFLRRTTNSYKPVTILTGNGVLGVYLSQAGAARALHIRPKDVSRYCITQTGTKEFSCRIATVDEILQYGGTTCTVNHAYEEVVQYTLDGKFVAVYPSIQSASVTTGASTGALSNALHGYAPTAGGFMWRYFKDCNCADTIPPVKMLSHSSYDLAVNVYDKFGNFVSQYKSAAECARALGTTSQNISGVCRRKGNSNGFQLRYAKDEHRRVIEQDTRDSLWDRPILQYSKDGKFIRQYNSRAELQSALGRSHLGDIYKVIFGKQLTAYGYIWRYKAIV